MEQVHNLIHNLRVRRRVIIPAFACIWGKLPIIQEGAYPIHHTSEVCDVYGCSALDNAAT